MSKIMLVIDNEAECDFLEKVLTRLSYDVIAMKKGSVLAEQLLDHFPDVVFASTLGKNQKILTALAKIKAARGKPKVVFVRQERESSPLNADQKKVIDGVIYSPIDPFKLIEVLSNVTPKSLQDLRQLYNDMLHKDKGSVDDTPDEANTGSVFGVGGVSINENEDGSKIITTGGGANKGGDSDSQVIRTGGDTTVSTNEDGSKIIATGGVSVNKSSSGVLIIDYERKKKYQEICDKLKSERTDPPPDFDGAKLRQLQKEQSQNISEDADVKKNRKHFLKTLFNMDIKGSKE